MTVGERLRVIRQEHKVKAKEIANLLGVNLRTYYRYEREERQINIYELIKLAKFYEETLDYICGLED